MVDLRFTPRLIARIAQALIVITLAAAEATAAVPLGPEGAQHLLTRAGFAPSPAEVLAFAPLTQTQAVDRLLAGVRTTASAPPPQWIGDPVIGPREFRSLPEESQKAERQRNVRRSLDLRRWWLEEMVGTPSPLTERMTLFWHNRFVSAQPKVRWPQLMYRQNVLLRQNAVGNFRVLLHAIARDPAMIVYLDSATNRRGRPNENFAREVMELFVLGRGHYTEQDIKEAARAFTGFSLDPDTLAFVYRPGIHDDGTKSVLGVRGPLDGDRVLDALLEEPAAAEFIVGKLWLEFVSPRPDPVRVAVIATRFRSSGYDIRTALRGVLMQPELVAAGEDDLLVKSPVELLVGLVRQGDGRLPNATGAAVAVAAMGQNLFSAPNVRGWPGGEAWINTQSLLVRKQSIERALARPEAAAREARAMLPSADAPPAGNPKQLLEAAQVMAAEVDPAAMLKSYRLQPERPLAADDIQRLAGGLLVVAPVSQPVPGTLAYDALRALLLDPAYQLK
ncbi:MAG TPA: DUF1800 domain-containing protein [Burkholderiaceae bacterium]|nr:DUF1800 domain-containing protein [Burkholderiaceae bacterium]